MFRDWPAQVTLGVSVCAIEAGPVCDFQYTLSPLDVLRMFRIMSHCCRLLPLMLFPSPLNCRGRWAGQTGQTSQPSHPNHFIPSLQCRLAVSKGGHLFTSLTNITLPTSALWVLTLWIPLSASQFTEVHNAASTDSTSYCSVPGLCAANLDLKGWRDGRNTKTWLL